MLVGDVRCATAGAGSSWKLSGGSQWSSGPTNVSKNRHVRRAMRRSASWSVAESRSATDSGGGRLTRRATTGDSSHRATNGRAIHPAPGFAARTSTAMAAASATPPAIWRKNRSSPTPCVALAWAAVIHSRRLRWVTYSRAIVRAIASPISHAWCARNVKPSPTWIDARATSAPTARRWLRFEMPARRGSSPAATGTAAGMTTD